ncbi:hypothetical protein JW859_11555 [bacterium]|nr:hypothetical protein [bacterium]
MGERNHHQGPPRHRHAGRRNERTQLLAVLLTDHPPQHALDLVPVAAAAAGHKLGFEPLHYLAEHQALLGLAAAEPAPSSPTRLPVQRGRRGSKPPEDLLLLGPAPRKIGSWPRPQLAGVLKAVGRALADAAGSAPPALPHWWLACQLALRGTIRRAEWKALWRSLGPDRPEYGARIERVGPLLAWREYLDQLVAEVGRRLSGAKRNPLLTELNVELAASLFNLQQSELAARVLQLAAEKYELSCADTEAGPVVTLAGALAPPPLSANDQRALAAMLALYGGEEGQPKSGLAERFPAQQHVIHWLFEAGRLVETQDGFVFTRVELDGYLTELATWGLPPGEIGVGDLRRRLGLKRRRAEALRGYLAARYGDAPEDGA